MKCKTEDGGWSPYLAGAMVGLLAIASVYATTQWMGKSNYLGASTTFVRAAGLLERTVAPDRVAANQYFTKEKVRVDWQFPLVLGIFLVRRVNMELFYRIAYFLVFLLSLKLIWDGASGIAGLA